LKDVAAVADKETALRQCLNAFRHNFKAQAVRERQGRDADGGIVFVGLDVLDEGAIKLERLDGQQL
jgi:hypothetical protein